MVLTQKHRQLAQRIDIFVRTIELTGGGDSELLKQCILHMATFKELLDSTTHEQLNMLCEAYPGFYRFAKLLEQLAQGITDGRISVPPVT